VTLAELLVSLAVAGVLMAATVSLLDEGQRLYAHGAARVEAQQSARMALERMAREIREAGLAPLDPGFPAISVALPTQIVLHFDVNGDGVIAGTKETVTWSLAGRVLRRNAGAGAQPIVNGVRDLVLEYRDAARRPTTSPAEVRSVTITLTTEPDHAPADSSRSAQARYTTEVRLRNR
jgi:Tfp pilus assembly protein PilW